MHVHGWWADGELRMVGLTFHIDDEGRERGGQGIPGYSLRNFFCIESAHTCDKGAEKVCAKLRICYPGVQEAWEVKAV